MHGCNENLGKFYGFCMDVTMKTPMFSQLGDAGAPAAALAHLGAFGSGT